MQYDRLCQPKDSCYKATSVLQHCWSFKLHDPPNSSSLQCRNGCWWHFDSSRTTQPIWTLLIQGASPCRGFRVFRHLNSTTAGIAAPAEVTHAAVQLLSSIKGSRGEAASSEAESQQRKPTWLLSLKTEKAVSLWVGKDAEVELTAEVMKSLLHADF